METMHSKFVRLRTALLMLALLFTVLVPVPAYAAGSAEGTANSVAISDPDTFNAWEYTQGYNNSTTGRIWGDKTVEENKITFSGDLTGQAPIEVPTDKGADFLVALSALSSYASTTTTDTQPLDIVMVLDASGSMDDAMGNNDSTKRMDALHAAVNNFIDKAAEKNAQITDTDKKIRLSIVKFSGKENTATGNDTYRDGGYTYNYSQIVQEFTACDSSNASGLKSKVNAVTPYGATRADNGMKRAKAALTSARTNAKKVVIFFTDGTPTSGSEFESSVASDAVKTAKEIKDAGAEIYTVGIFSGANPNALVDSNRTSSENKFMQAVSSNYPKATYSYTSSGLFGGSYNWNFGTKAASADYYLAASSAAGLNNVFESIFTSVSTLLPGPTDVTGNPQQDGYVTFDDTLGDYMEVKSFEAVAFAEHVFKQPTKITSGNVDTYTFTGKHDDTVSGAYPDTGHLSQIIITVTHGSDGNGDRVQVKIPASMLPLRYYKITNTDNTPKLEVNDVQPISVIYSVGLKADARNQIASGSFTDPKLAAYVADNAKDGEISFYSNKFDSSKTTADKQKTIGLTTATFTPATSNSYYYHTEDTLLYTKTGEGENATYTPATVVEPNKTYYYKLNYLKLLSPDHTETRSETDYVPISIATDQEIEKCITTKKMASATSRRASKKAVCPPPLITSWAIRQKIKPTPRSAALTSSGILTQTRVCCTLATTVS